METFLQKQAPRENGQTAEYTVIPLEDLTEKDSFIETPKQILSEELRLDTEPQDCLEQMSSEGEKQGCGPSQFWAHTEQTILICWFKNSFYTCTLKLLYVFMYLLFYYYSSCQVRGTNASWMVFAVFDICLYIVNKAHMIFFFLNLQAWLCPVSLSSKVWSQLTECGCHLPAMA